MGKKYLIILDVDKTLLDVNYRSTSPTINSVIEQMKAEGNIFLLNSNRSLDDLLPVANQFGINGLIIGENGCFIYDQKTKESRILVRDEDIIQIAQVRRILPEIISENFPKSYYIVGDTTDFNKRAAKEDLPRDYEYFFILNQYRKYSLSLHVRKIAKEIEKDLDATKKLFDLIKNYVERQQMELGVDYTESYCNILVYPKNNNKGKAFNEVARAYSDFIKVIIGDDYLDKPLMEEVDYFFAVNNATDDVKRVADYVSSETITKGVEEILLNIDKITN